MRLQEFGLMAKDGLIYKQGGRKNLTDKELMNFLMDKNVPMQELYSIQAALNQEAQSSIISEMSYEEYLVAKRQIFENCVYNKRIKTIKTESGIMAYICSEIGWKTLGLAKELDSKMLTKEFIEKYANEVVQLTEQINCISPKGKSPRSFKHEEVADMYLETMTPSDEKKVLNGVNSSPIPILLKGDLRPAFEYLDYEKNDLPVLNPFMKDFLDRMHNSDYFCGYLYCTFLGIEIQQLLYLYGEGQNGKSSFTKVLAAKTKVAAFSDVSRHDLVSLEGAAFIVLSESEGGHILLKPIIKKITGKDLLTFDPKYKVAYSGRVSGTIIVDSNNRPYVLGEKAETRRLRLFEIKAPKISETIEGKRFAELMGENFNDFINHCRLCYERLKTNDGTLIKDPPDLDEQIASLVDRDAEAHYNIMISHLKTKRFGNIEISSKLSISEAVITEKILAATRMLNGKFQDKFFINNFIKYLLIWKGVRTNNGVMYGIGVSEPIKDEEIQKAMPTF